MRYKSREQFHDMRRVRNGNIWMNVEDKSEKIGAGAFRSDYEDRVHGATGLDDELKFLNFASILRFIVRPFGVALSAMGLLIP